jgi:hypothetical protein
MTIKYSVKKSYKVPKEYAVVRYVNNKKVGKIIADYLTKKNAMLVRKYATKLYNQRRRK